MKNKNIIIKNSLKDIKIYFLFIQEQRKPACMVTSHDAQSPKKNTQLQTFFRDMIN